MLAAPAGALNTLEHVSPTGLWILDLPSEGNRFPLENIADVRLVMYFTAQFDPALAEAQRQYRASASGVPLERGGLLLGRSNAAASRQSFIGGPDGINLVDMRYFEVEVSAGDELTSPGSRESIAVFVALGEHVKVVEPDLVALAPVAHARCVQPGQIGPCAQDDGVLLGEPVEQADSSLLVERELDADLHRRVPVTTTTSGFVDASRIGFPPSSRNGVFAITNA